MNSLRTAAAVALLLVAGQTAMADCGACKPSGCGNDVPGCCEPILVMQCVRGCETEKVTKQCFETECDHICVPAVSLPWKRCPGNHCNIGLLSGDCGLFAGKGCGLFGGKGCGLCDHDGCGANGCDSGCGNGGCIGNGACGNGNGCHDGGCGNGLRDKLFGRLCSKLTDCQVKRVRTFKAKEIDCGERCVCTWTLQKWYIDGCATGCCKPGDGCGSTQYGGCVPCGE